MKQEDYKDLSEWNFPEMDTNSEPKSEELAEFPVINLDIQAVEVRETTQPTVQHEEVNKEQQEIALKHSELEQAKTEYQNKIQLIDTMVNKLKNPLSIIDEDLIEVIHDLIRKISSKIIHREIKTDPSLLSSMINELKSLVDAGDGMISISLAENDFERLKLASDKSIALANVDPSISEGDIIVKSNFSEVRAILNERIDQLLRIQYD